MCIEKSPRSELFKLPVSRCLRESWTTAGELSRHERADQALRQRERVILSSVTGSAKRPHRNGYDRLRRSLFRSHPQAAENHLSKTLYGLACRQFDSEWPAYVRVELNEGILVLACDLIQRHPLRGFDAVHLASALSLRNALGERITFVAADRRLLKAAESEKLDVLNIETADAQ